MILDKQLFEILAILLTTVGAVWSLAWWLSRQFATIKSALYDKIEKCQSTILAKLEYHEQHDDNRFSQVHERIAAVRDDIWEIRLRNASKDGVQIKGISLDPTDTRKK